MLLFTINTTTTTPPLPSTAQILAAIRRPALTSPNKGSIDKHLGSPRLSHSPPPRLLLRLSLGPVHLALLLPPIRSYHAITDFQRRATELYHSHPVYRTFTRYSSPHTHLLVADGCSTTPFNITRPLPCLEPRPPLEPERRLACTSRLTLWYNQRSPN